MTTKLVKLCADDFGYNDYVSQGIIHLIKQKRLSATSCITNRPVWNNHLSELLNFREQIEIGLHLNLTEGCSSLNQPINKLILGSYLGKFALTVVEKELQIQLDEFKDKTGFLPDYIDGHQHIQQLPVIRNAVINIIKQNYVEPYPYIRISSNGLIQSLKTSPKALFIHLLGASALLKLAKKNSIPVNNSFSGFSNFKDDDEFPSQFEAFLTTVKNKGLIMCHPGLADPSGNDSIAASRAKEYRFFNSPIFTELLYKHQVTLHFGRNGESND